MPWKLTIRSGPRVQRQRFDDLAAALGALETEARALANQTSRAPVNARLRRFEPVQQVAARIEVAGPERLLASTRAGVDVRGDGSTEAYVGRTRRRALEQRRGETPYDALRRELGGR